MNEADRADKFCMSPLGTVMTQCVYCVHDLPGPMNTCAAFPEGIPAEIVSNTFDHRREVEGDHGVRFEPRPDVPPTVLEQLYRTLDAAG